MPLCINKETCLYVKIKQTGIKKTAADILIQAAGFISFTIN